MRNPIFIFAAFLLFGLSACNSVDKELVSKMQKDVDEMSGLSAAFEEMQQSTSNLAERVSNTPEEMKIDDATSFKDLNEMLAAMAQKQQATIAEYNDLMQKLKNLVAEYSAGKVKTEDAQKEYENLHNGLQGIADLSQRIRERSDQMETNFAKMTATWKAKTEGSTPAE
ncbi:MAG: hypothetical protein H6565_09395 [Lewinellaceae bacterium]|nr:hypothetical protein [Lewinellaceae bacterium]MCB9354427.1 hypothetical protein [Lewinellaceae bacterium]